VRVSLHVEQIDWNTEPMDTIGDMLFGSAKIRAIQLLDLGGSVISYTTWLGWNAQHVFGPIKSFVVAAKLQLLDELGHRLTPTLDLNFYHSQAMLSPGMMLTVTPALSAVP
jgi:hypothetical protein